MPNPNKDTDLGEALAALAHEQWSGWIEYIFIKGIFNDDGTLTIPARDVKSWKRQMNTPYDELTGLEKYDARAEAERVLQVFKEMNDA